MFLILSNPRTGSTWLELMLAALPDIQADYEIKWQPEYEPNPLVHIVLGRGGSVAEELTSRGLDGSKLVLDYRQHLTLEYSALAACIDPRIKLIHLTRDYFDVVCSVARGCFHKLGKPSDTELARNLTTLESDQGLPITLRTPPHALWMNDDWIRSLAQTHEILTLGYTEIPARFEEVARFVGSEATVTELVKVLSNPPVVKTPVKRAYAIFSNPGEARRMCNRRTAF